MANPYVNKVVFGGETVVDLTGDTATAADVAQGKTFHLANGAQATGTLVGVSAMTDAEVVAAADAGWIQTFTFSVQNYGGFTAEEDMTWTQWVNSSYNTADFYISDTLVWAPNGYHLSNVRDTQKIEENATYTLSKGGGDN